MSKLDMQSLLSQGLDSPANDLESTMWYCAHAIFYFKVEDQASFLVHENVYLIEAASDDRAMQDAIKVAKENEDLSEDGHLEVNGQKAEYRFAGIRKLIQLELSPETSRGALISGVEATYSVLEVDTLEQVERLAAGEQVPLLYRE